MSNTESKTPKVWQTLKAIGKWIYRLRSVILAIPVAIAAVILAIQNQAKLPNKPPANMPRWSAKELRSWGLWLLLPFAS